MKLPTFSQNAFSEAYEFHYTQSNDHPSFTVEFDHCYANDVVEHAPILMIWRDGERFRVFPDAVLAQMVQDVIDNEGVEPPLSWYDDKLDYKTVRNIGTRLSCEEIVEDAKRRWSAIQLIASPHVTKDCRGHIYKNERE